MGIINSWLSDLRSDLSSLCEYDIDTHHSDCAMSEVYLLKFQPVLFVSLNFFCGFVCP
jgi:hypothetical protein